VISGVTGDGSGVSEGVGSGVAEGEGVGVSEEVTGGVGVCSGVGSGDVGSGVGVSSGVGIVEDVGTVVSGGATTVIYSGLLWTAAMVKFCTIRVTSYIPGLSYT